MQYWKERGLDGIRTALEQERHESEWRARKQNESETYEQQERKYG
jgi:hypothetical protein